MFVSALISLWGGFALVFTSTIRRPGVLDFLAPFVLLACISRCAWCIGQDDAAQALLALAAASGLSALLLYIEYFSDEDPTGPLGPAILQTVLAALALLLALGIVAGADLEIAALAAAALALAQAGGILGVVSAWQALTAD